MQKAIWNSDYKKTDFYFIDDDRSIFDALQYGSKVDFTVKDKKGNIVTIPFSVTRNAFLGSYSHWIYGKVLDTGDDMYRQIEIRLNSKFPEYDTICVFPQAPPLRIEEDKLQRKTQ